jgi:lysophospholipase L1-like esterase
VLKLFLHPDVWLTAMAAGAGGFVWYRVGHDLSNVWTSVLFLLGAGMAAAVAARLLLRLLRRPAVLPHVTLLVATTTLMLVTLELGLRYGVATRATYGESNGSPVYRSIYRYDNPTWYHLYGKNGRIREVKTEFTHARTTNALGLTEHDVALAKAANEYRVLALGDSYTEGVGAEYEESWVRVFERAMSPLPDGRVVRAINAGISGSDLMLEYVLFRDRLAEYRPDLVVVALNNSDIADVMTRGGMERFRADGRIRGDRGPSWDWLYGISYITRHVIHDVLDRSWLLLSPDEHSAAQATARRELRGTLDAVEALAKDLGAAFVLVLNPHQYEVKDGRYEPGFGPLVEQLTAANPPHVIDLLELYKQAGTITPDNSGDYYWTLDYHHNARGYAIMGETIAAEVRARRLLAGAH